MHEQPSANIWTDAEQRYQPEQEVRGVVTRITQFGAFVQVEPGLEGIVYAFELGAGPTALAGIAPGQEMTLYVRSIDASRKRLELSLHHGPTPGLLALNNLPPELRAKKFELPAAQSLSSAHPTLTREENQPGEPRCPSCQRALQAHWKFCVYCGESLQRRCPACHSLQPDLSDARYCYECGQLL